MFTTACAVRSCGARIATPGSRLNTVASGWKIDFANLRRSSRCRYSRRALRPLPDRWALDVLTPLWDRAYANLRYQDGDGLLPDRFWRVEVFQSVSTSSDRGRLGHDELPFLLLSPVL